MRSVVRLKRLRNAGSRRAYSLRTLVDSLKLPPSTEQERVIAYATIEAHNLWASFARAYYLSCVLKARRVSGPNITITQTGLRTVTDGIQHAVRLLKPWVKSGPPFTRRDEPAWHELSTLLKLLASIGASNLSQVQSALSYPTTVFTVLPTVRNFFAHRNDKTARKVANAARSSLGLSAKLKPASVVCSVLPGRPQNVLADWLDDLRAVMALLCQ